MSSIGLANTIALTSISKRRRTRLRYNPDVRIVIGSVAHRLIRGKGESQHRIDASAPRPANNRDISENVSYWPEAWIERLV